MPDLDSITASLPLDLLFVIVIFITYWMTNSLKDKYCLAKHDVHLTAMGLGIVFNLFREIALGLRFPSGLPILCAVILYGILAGILATGNHKLIQAIARKYNLPVYRAEESSLRGQAEPDGQDEAQEYEPPIVLDPPTLDNDGPDPALASTPAVTRNPV